MVGSFLWANGQLHLRPGRVDPFQLHSKLGSPQEFAVGVFSISEYESPAFDAVKVQHAVGSVPSERHLRFIVRNEIMSYGREERLQRRVRVSATSEDTEAAGKNVGFLREPKSELYPPLFQGGQTIPVEVRSKLKSHVLNVLELEFVNPDQWIYFTIYGSGISYNWDEGGDLDLQMWVDHEKYMQQGNEDLTVDDLIAAVRRNVQQVNFPSFKDLGLESPAGAEEEADGSMLIQYYPKPGKGTPEENLASKPYACYDLETDEWLEEPEPIEPTFYGEQFVLLLPKAEDIALQAEALIAEYERDILNWQFWFALDSQVGNPAYKDQMLESRDRAEQEKAGIKNLFDGVFQGRAKAYSPEGKGIEDERDMIQKLLEVWGIFQKLKHYAREPLPWDKQEMPKEAVELQDYHYHVAPTTERARIQTYGLYPGFPRNNPYWGGGAESQPEGVYAWESIEAALDWADIDHPKVDIWRIPDQQIQTTVPDPFLSAQRGVIIPHHVWPELHLGAEDLDSYWRYVRGEAEVSPYLLRLIEGNLIRQANFVIYSADVRELADKMLKRIIQEQFMPWQQKSEKQKKWLEEQGASENEIHRLINNRIKWFMTAFSDLSKNAPETYKLWPWLFRTWKKNVDGQGDPQLNPTGHIIDILRGATQHLDKLRDNPTERVPDIMAFQGFNDLEAWVYEMNGKQVAEGEPAQNQKVYDYGDGWTIQRVHPDNLNWEGEQMGHCVGSYCTYVTRGDTNIFSLRGPKGYPHTTVEIKGGPKREERVHPPDPTPDDGGRWIYDEEGDYMFKEVRQEPLTPGHNWEVVQIQGKQDSEPIPEYKARIKQWFESLREQGVNVEWSPDAYMHGYDDAEDFLYTWEHVADFKNKWDAKGGYIPRSQRVEKFDEYGLPMRDTPSLHLDDNEIVKTVMEAFISDGYGYSPRISPVYKEWYAQALLWAFEEKYGNEQEARKELFASAQLAQENLDRMVDEFRDQNMHYEWQIKKEIFNEYIDEDIEYDDWYQRHEDPYSDPIMMKMEDDIRENLEAPFYPGYEFLYELMKMSGQLDLPQPQPQTPPQVQQDINQTLDQDMPPMEQPNNEPGTLDLPGTFSRVGMAERTGDSELDSLIDEFMNTNEDYLRCYKNPEDAYGKCVDVSEYFTAYLRKRGIQALNAQEGQGILETEGQPIFPPDRDYFPPDWHGLSDPEEDWHDATVVQKDGQTYLIDWTASQFGVTEFPLVQRLRTPAEKEEWEDDAGEIFEEWVGPEWDRKWSALQSDLASTIVANGGGTFDHNLDPVVRDNGYFVSAKGWEEAVPVTELQDRLDGFIGQVGEFMEEDGLYLGAWIEGDMVYLDLSRWFEDKEEAIDFGRANEQRAIWDVENADSIYINEEKVAALQGLPQSAIGPYAELQDLAQAYAEQQGIRYQPPQEYVPVDPNRAKAIADEYDRMEHNPNDPNVKASYDAFKEETLQQYNHLVDSGYVFEFYPQDFDPYPKGPRQALEDLRENKHLYVYPTSAGFGTLTEDPYGDHPLLEDTGIEWNGQPVTYNDIFRGVHDVFGHAKEGVGFRWDGEDNAWRQHAAMYSELARPAMTAETRGQNSWVNFGPYGETNQTANQEETVYADQKAGILPEWVHQDSVFNVPAGGIGAFSSVQKTAEPGYPSPEHRDPGGWAGIMEKAQRLRTDGQVQVQLNTPDHVLGVVQGDHGTYQTELWRDDPNAQAITLWDCDCQWEDYSWGRTRQFRKYEGRPCSHTLALYWESMSTPLDTDAYFGDEEGQMPLPQDYLPSSLPGGQQPIPAPAQSQLVAPQQGEQLTLPGTFSSWEKSSAFVNGDYVRLNVAMSGYDEDGGFHRVPRNKIAEVIWSDEVETIVIVPTDLGRLEAHNVRLQGPTSSFTKVPRSKGTAPRRHR